LVTTTTVEPHKATIVERFIGLFRIPYLIGSIILALLLGPLGAFLSSYACTSDVNEAISRTVILFFGSSLPPFRGIAGLVTLFLLFFYCLYMIRYMRLKILKTEEKLISLLQDEEDTFHQIFGQITKPGPPILFGLIFMVIFTLQFVIEVPDNFKIFCTHPINIAYLGISYPFWFIIFSTFVWMYVGSIWSLHELGKKLVLKKFHEDKMLGVKPVGSLSLSLTYTYFAGLSLLVLLPTIIAPDSPTLSYVLTLSLFIILGISLFFLPLNTVHKKMIEAKKMEQEMLRNELFTLVQDTKDADPEDPESMSEIKNALTRLTSVLTVEVTKDEVDDIPTWPFDTEILSRLLALSLSVAAVIVANYIMRKVIHLIP
jgi:hypothetical protein